MPFSSRDLKKRLGVDGVFKVLKKEALPTLLGGCSRVLSTLLLLAGKEVDGAAGLFGNTTATPSVTFPRSAVLGGALILATGLEVLSLVLAAVERAAEAVVAVERVDEAAAVARRVDEAVVAVERVDAAVLELLPLSSWRWMVGGSCFMGLSRTQKVSRLMGLSVPTV